MAGPTPEAAWIVRNKLLYGPKPTSMGQARAIASSAPCMLSVNDDDYSPNIAGSFRDSRHFDLGTGDDIRRCVEEAMAMIDRTGAVYVFGESASVAVVALLAGRLGAAKSASDAIALVARAWSDRIVRSDKQLPFTEERRKQVEQMFVK